MLAQAGDETAYGGRGFDGGGGLDELDQGTADDGGVGKLSNGGDVFRGGDAEAESDGEVERLGEGAQAVDELLGVAGDLLLGAGDADAGDGIDEAAAGRGDGLEALVGAGGRGEEDGSERVGAHMLEVLGGLLDDHVGEQDAVDAGGCGLLAEGLHAELDDGIEVGEED